MLIILYLRNVDISGGHIGDVYIGSTDGTVNTENPVLGIISSGDIEVKGSAIIETEDGYIKLQMEISNQQQAISLQ